MNFDFAVFIAAVIDHLKSAFPAVGCIEEYPRLRKKIVAPAILVELADAIPAADTGTEQLCLSARFEARIVFDQVAVPPAKPDMQALTLAAAAAQAIYKQGRFAAGAGSAKEFRIEPDQFKPELAGYCVWLVTWTHEIRLGTSIWDGEGILPTEIYAGISPEIGDGHEDDYVKVGGGQ